MMSAWHLLWIVPVAGSLGALALAFFVAVGDGEDDEEDEEDGEAGDPLQRGL